VLQATVSYRSIPRLLRQFRRSSSAQAAWIPHFTSIIFWTLRLGLGLLKQVERLNQPWAAIIDHSIDIGTKKALVVLRVPLDHPAEKKRALRLSDCECIGLRISETVNADTIAVELGEIFEQSGLPDIIIKDGDRTLNKGVTNTLRQYSKPISMIDDIGHYAVRVLKNTYAKTDDYKRFTHRVSEGAKKLRQTAFAFLIPPKLRSKGRFQNVSKIGKWGARIIRLLDDKPTEQNEDAISRLREAFPDFEQLKDFIQEFAHTTRALSLLMKIIKNKGLGENNYRRCEKVVSTLPKENGIQPKIRQWLDEHRALSRQLPVSSLMVSSDVIESLFGRFKYAVERSPQADMNRTVLLIPALCGNLDDDKINRALSLASCKDVSVWEEENIPYTVRKKRIAFFKEGAKPKKGE